MKPLVLSFAPDLKAYNTKKLMADVSAGLIVGIVALPLSLALAISVGVNPVIGLYTAAVAGLFSALVSGARFNVSGPAAAMVPILAGIFERFDKDFDKLQYVGFLAGLLLVIFGVLKIGKLIQHVPHVVTVAFTAGVALVIFVGQLPSFLGLSKLGQHEHFHEKFLDMLEHAYTFHTPSIIIGAVSVLVILYAQRYKPIKKIPSTLLAIVVTTLAVRYVGYFDGVKTIAEKFGTIPSGLPLPSLTFIIDNFDQTGSMIIPALKVALLISIETLLCAVVADKLTNTRHRSNQELSAQGIGNALSPLFGGFASTAVIARTGTIVKSGAVSRLASAIHALVVLLFIAVLAPVAGSLPLPALSAVLLVTAWRISEQKEVRALLAEQGNGIVKLTLLLTLLLTVFTDLVIGVGAGVVFYYFAKGFTHEQRILHGERFDDDALVDPDELEEVGLDEGTDKQGWIARFLKRR